MEVTALAIGRLKSGPESELCARYLERARKTGRSLGLRGFAVLELPEGRGQRAAERITAETAALLGVLEQGWLVCLDPGGALVDSEAFASEISQHAAAGVPRTIFVIGGPDGLGEALLERANQRLSFGRLVWPHQLVRIMLAEQLYRATTILSGHPYHRA